MINLAQIKLSDIPNAEFDEAFDRARISDSMRGWAQRNPCGKAALLDFLNYNGYHARFLPSLHGRFGDYLYTEQLTPDDLREIFAPRHTGLSSRYEEWIKDNKNILQSEQFFSTRESPEQQAERFMELSREDLEPFIPGTIPRNVEWTFTPGKMKSNGYITYMFRARYEKKEMGAFITDTWRWHSKTAGAPDDSLPNWRGTRKISGDRIETEHREFVRRTPDNFRAIDSFGCRQEFDGTWTTSLREWVSAQKTRNARQVEREASYSNSLETLKAGHLVFIPGLTKEEQLIRGGILSTFSPTLDFNAALFTLSGYLSSNINDYQLFHEAQFDEGGEERRKHTLVRMRQQKYPELEATFAHIGSYQTPSPLSLGLLTACIFYSNDDEVFQLATISLAGHSRPMASQLIRRLADSAELAFRFHFSTLLKIAPFFDRSAGRVLCEKVINQFELEIIEEPEVALKALETLFSISAEECHEVATRIITDGAHPILMGYAFDFLKRTGDRSVDKKNVSEVYHPARDFEDFGRALETDSAELLGADKLETPKIEALRILKGNDQLYKIALWAGAFDPVVGFRMYCREKLHEYFSETADKFNITKQIPS